MVFVLGVISGIIITLLAMLSFFVVGYNTIGTLLQIFSPEVEVPTLRQLQKSRKIRKQGDDK